MKFFLSLREVDVYQKRIIVREDFNVPIQEGFISSDARLQAALPTLKYLLEKQARILIFSHLGRPQNSQFSKENSLVLVAEKLSELLKHPVKFLKHDFENINLQPGEIALFENIRFLKGEESNDEGLAQRMAAQCDVFVMDAFACAHRAHASTEGIIHKVPLACAGFLLEKEILALNHSLENPQRPLLAIVGGSKVSTKVGILEQLLHKVEILIVGGGIANTFLKAAGFEIGASLFEENFIEQAKNLLGFADKNKKQLPLPIDVVVANECTSTATASIKDINHIEPQDRILDIGPKTQTIYSQWIKKAGTILCNGPVGVFEIPAFSKGTQTILEAMAQSTAYTLAGGGDTIAALEKFNLSKSISYISTAGGAFMEFLEGKDLPSLAALRQRALEYARV